MKEYINEKIIENLLRLYITALHWINYTKREREIKIGKEIKQGDTI